MYSICCYYSVEGVLSLMLLLRLGCTVFFAVYSALSISTTFDSYDLLLINGDHKYFIKM